MASGCYWDNYLFLTAYNKTYTQTKWTKNRLNE